MTASPVLHVTLICLEAWGIIDTSYKVPPCVTCFLALLIASSLLSGEPSHLTGPQMHQLMLPLTCVMLLFIGGEPVPFPHLSVYSLLQLTVDSSQIPLLPQSFPWQLSPDGFMVPEILKCLQFVTVAPKPFYFLKPTEKVFKENY